MYFQFSQSDCELPVDRGHGWSISASSVVGGWKVPYQYSKGKKEL